MIHAKDIELKDGEMAVGTTTSFRVGMKWHGQTVYFTTDQARMLASKLVKMADEADADKRKAEGA